MKRAEARPTFPYPPPESARGLAQSKTLRAVRGSSENAPASWTAVALYRFSPRTTRTTRKLKPDSRSRIWRLSRFILLQLLQSCFHFARSPSVAAARQRWAECFNRIAVGARLCPAPSGISRSTFANPRRKTFSTASAHPPAATGPADTVALRPKAPSGAKSL